MLPRTLPFWLIAAFAFVSCSQLGGLTDALAPYTPKMSFKKLSLRHIDFQKVDVDFVFAVDNPNPINVKLDTYSYALGLANVELLKGSNDDGFALKANGSSELSLPVSLTFADIFKTVENIGGKDEIPFAISGDFGWNTPVGVARIPFKETGNFPVVRPPDVSIKGISGAKLNLLNQTASVNVDIGLANKEGGAPISFDGLDYKLDFGGRNVAGGVMQALPQVAGGAEQTVSIPVSLKLLEVGAAIASAVTGKKALDVGFGATVTVGTPFGPIPLSIDEKGNFRVN